MKVKDSTKNNWYGYCSIPNNMKKLLGILFALFTLTTYSQEYDDVYYTVYDDTPTASNDTLIEESDTYITNNYYTDYTSRINRFHRRPYYTSYWSYYNPYWYSYFYYGHYSSLSFYWWWNSPWGYGYYSDYNYPYWYSHNHHNHHGYNNHYSAHNTYYGPHYKKSNGDKKIKTVKTISKIKSKPVNNHIVKTHNKPIKPHHTYTTRASSYTSPNKVRPRNVSNNKTYNKPITKVNTNRTQYPTRPKVTNHQIYNRPSRTFTPRTNSFNKVRSSSTPTKSYSRSRPR